MTESEYFLLKLAEEGAEVAQDASKVMCFGLHETNHLNPTGPNNQERLVNEINDFLGVVELLVQEGVLPKDWLSREKIEAKKIKVRKYLGYCKSIGTVE